MGSEAPTNLEEVMDRLGDAASDRQEVSLGALIESVGRRSFGPVLLIAGIVGISPLSSIPVITVAIAVLVIAISVQLLLHRRHFWLPQWVSGRKLSRDKLLKGVRWIKPAARFMDRILRPRLTKLTEGAGAHVVAVTCILIAAAMPPLALVPFAPTTAGIALTAFGLSLTAHDGLMGLIAFATTATIVWLALRTLLGG